MFSFCIQRNGSQTCSDWHKQPGCHYQPLFDFDLKNVIMYELHLMLRVTDRLEEGLIKDIMLWDKVCIKAYIYNLF